MMRLFKYIRFLVGAFALYAFYTMMYWREYYTRHLPRTIDTQDGSVIPLQLNHQIVVYATFLEKQKLDDTLNMVWIALGGIFLTVLLQFLIKYKKGSIEK
jgi:hypothetical protein